MTEQAVAITESEKTSTTIIQVIERAALNPDVDIDKMERLLQMQERIMDREAQMEYTATLAEMQPKLPVIEERGGIKNRDGKVQSRYARWEDINEAIRDILSENGFTLTFRTGKDGDQITVTGILAHRGGHSEETTITLPMDTSGSKNAVQAVGSSTSYGKRYTTQALLNLTSRGEDNDGQTAVGAITAEQKTKIIALMQNVGADTAKFLQHMGFDSVDEIPANQFQRAINALEAKGRAT